jgi:hypothetical protein
MLTLPRCAASRRQFQQDELGQKREHCQAHPKARSISSCIMAPLRSLITLTRCLQVVVELRVPTCVPQTYPMSKPHQCCLCCHCRRHHLWSSHSPSMCHHHPSWGTLQLATRNPTAHHSTHPCTLQYTTLNSFPGLDNFSHGIITPGPWVVHWLLSCIP